MPDPAGLVFAAAMKQIENRISLIQIFLVSRRSIDPAIPQSAGIGGAVVFTSHRAVGNVLEIVKIKFRIRHIHKIAQPVVGVADGSVLIQMLLPIEEVIKELHAAGDSGNNRLPPTFPLRLMQRTLFLAHSRIAGAADFNAFRVWRINVELHTLGTEFNCPRLPGVAHFAGLLSIRGGRNHPHPQIRL